MLYAKRVICLLCAFLSSILLLGCFFTKNVNTANACELDDETTKKEIYWYDDEGKMIEDEELLSNLNKAQTVEQRGAFCCSPDTMHKVVTYTEEHTYVEPLPSWCVYDRFKIVVCDHCYAVWSRTYEGRFNHIHS